MIRGNIDTIAFGGQGILRDDGYVIFVPFTAPGDTVEIELVRKKKQHGEGKLLRVVTPSPLRSHPLCPYFGTCGGCQLQHITAEAQREIKRQFIQDSLGRIAAASIAIPPIIPSKQTWGYRKHIRMNIRDGAAGYIGYQHNTFVPVDQCPIFHDANDPILIDVQAFIKKISWEKTPMASVRIFKTQGQYILVFNCSPRLPDNLLEQAVQALKLHPSWRGILLSAPKQKLSVGNVECRFELLDLNLQFSPFGFIQNNPEQSESLYRFILDQIPQGATKALDLYCGIGATSLLLAKQGIHTVGIESHPETVKMAIQNAKDNGIKCVEFHCGKAETLASVFLKKNSFDLVLLNPPRTGLDDQLIDELLSACPKNLIYVSCMPPTLARDLRRFLEKGYRIEQVQGFEMFPQTTHVETVVKLSQKSSPHR